MEEKSESNTEINNGKSENSINTNVSEIKESKKEDNAELDNSIPKPKKRTSCRKKTIPRIY